MGRAPAVFLPLTSHQRAPADDTIESPYVHLLFCQGICPFLYHDQNHRLEPVSLAVLYVMSIDMKGNWMEIIKTGENENMRGPNST